MSSPFAGAFTTFDLTFQTAGSGLVVDPATGLQRPDAGTPVTVTIMLKASGNIAIRHMLGADELDTVLVGRMVDPMKMPASVRPGSVAPLTVNGTPGEFRLGPAWPGPIPAVDDALGDPVYATWRASAP